MALIPYAVLATRCCGRESHAPAAVRPPSADQQAPPPVPVLPAPGREAPVARPLAARPDRPPPHPGRGGRPGRAVRGHGPPRPAPVERPRAWGRGRPAGGERGRPQADAPPPGRPVPSPPGATPRRGAVDRPEGRPVRPRPVAGGGPPGDRLALAAGPRVHPPGPPPVAPPRG